VLESLGEELKVVSGISLDHLGEPGVEPVDDEIDILEPKDRAAVGESGRGGRRHRFLRFRFVRRLVGGHGWLASHIGASP